MNDLELDAIANGVFKYILEQTDHPLDGIAILGLVMLKIFENSARNMTIEEYAHNIKDSLVESYRSASAEGTETVQ